MGMDGEGARCKRGRHESGAGKKGKGRDRMGRVRVRVQYGNRLKFHLARLDSTRLDTFDFVEPVEQVETSVSSETSRALPTWRTTHDLVQV